MPNGSSWSAGELSRPTFHRSSDNLRPPSPGKNSFKGHSGGLIQACRGHGGPPPLVHFKLMIAGPCQNTCPMVDPVVKQEFSRALLLARAAGLAIETSFSLIFRPDGPQAARIHDVRRVLPPGVHPPWTTNEQASPIRVVQLAHLRRSEPRSFRGEAPRLAQDHSRAWQAGIAGFGPR